MDYDYKLVIDNNILENYYKYYFSKHPRARNKPIKNPWHESINVWSILPRIQMNALKQKYKEFTVWWIKSLKLQNLKLEKIKLTFITYTPTKRRTDPDNYVPKFYLDGLTESGFIADDDRNHIKKLSLICDVDKNNPRTEILVKILKEE